MEALVDLRAAAVRPHALAQHTHQFLQRLRVVLENSHIGCIRHGHLRATLTGGNIQQAASQAHAGQLITKLRASSPCALRIASSPGTCPTRAICWSSDMPACPGG